jgi:hypothetical protein
MYCPSCGAESTVELNYCNRCGASMAPSTVMVPISLTKPAIIIGIIVTALTLGGFSILIEGAIRLATVFHVPDPIMAIIMLGMATIIACDFLLLRLLSRIVRTSLEQKHEKPAMLPKQKTREEPRQLSPQFEPVPSVTEHTTRTFAPVFREPSDRGTK